MIKEQDDRPHPDKKFMHYVERHQQSTLAQQRVILSHYDPQEEVANINKLDRFHKKIKPQ